MSGNTPIRGIRDPINGGTIVGNLGSSSGPPYAIPFQQLVQRLIASVPPGAAFGPILNNLVVSNISGAANVPIGNTLSSIIDAAIGSTQGDILYRNAAGWVVLPPSTSGFLLTTGGAGANPAWAAEAHVGTVTSVAETFTGGLISVAGSPITTSGTLALTVAGTSGGIPYFSGATTWASSAALAASAIVLGGGAGNPPATTTTGTGVVTALGVNVGTAGSFITNGGALGSPSSAGTIPAFTLGGTVSGGGNQINNVIIGTTTPLAGHFTTLDATGTITPNQTAGIVGTTTNNDVTAGGVGEYVESIIAFVNAVSLTNNSEKTMTSISLTAGDWDVTGTLLYAIAGSATINYTQSSTSLTNNASDSETATATLAWASGTLLSVGNVGVQVPTRRFSLSSTTTIYMIARSGFAVGTVDAYGFIRARRIR